MSTRNMSPGKTSVESTRPIRRQGGASETQSGGSDGAVPHEPSLAENLWMTIKLLVIAGGVGLLIWLLDTIRVR